MRLARLLRTSSFRLTLLYAGITGISFLVLFAVVLWSASGFMQQQIDGGVAAELREIHIAAAGTSTSTLAPIINSASKEAGEFHYALQDVSGRRITGDLPALAPILGTRDKLSVAPASRGGALELRGVGEATSDGGYLFVGTSSHQIHELRESLTQSFLLGAAAATLLTLVGGALTSMAVLRRIEEVSQTSRDIVDGDLARRIPLNGSGDEFDHLAISLNGMLDRITALMADLEQVSANIAHDLRTPLTRLRQRLELANGHAPSAATPEQTIADALVEVDAILQTFSALLRISQIRSGHRRANFGDVDVSEVLDTVIDVYQPAIEDKAQQLSFTLEPGLLIDGDRELLVQMFVNLIENASRHCPAGTHIEVSARRVDGCPTVLVADDGPGIPADARRKVLQRFFRMDASRSSPGNGLGLSLVDAVAKLHAARLALEDKQPGLQVRVVFRPKSAAAG